MKVYDYKSISLYSDKKGTLYAIPTGLNHKFNITVAIDILNILEPPYSDDDVQEFILKTFNQCYTKEREDLNSIGSLEKHFGVKKYSTAVRSLKCIPVDWRKDEGYSITPTKKVPREGFIHLEDKIIILGHNPEEGAIAAAIRQAIDESTTF